MRGRATSVVLPALVVLVLVAVVAMAATGSTPSGDGTTRPPSESLLDTIFTLGLFLLVVNALMVLLVSKMMSGFTVDSFWQAMLAAIIVTIIGWTANAFIGGRGFERYKSGRRPL